MSFFQIVAFPQAAPPGEQLPYSIEGVVHDAVSGAPIANAVVTAVLANSPSGVANTQTGSDGAFTLHLRAPGEYRLMTSAPGYSVSSPAGAGAIGATVAVSDSGVPARTTLTLYKTGVIHGRFVDEISKKPLPGIRLILSKREYREGYGIASTTYPSSTGATGEFEIPGIEPGTYYLEAIAPPAMDNTGTGYGTQWYPGVTAFEDAVAIQVALGEEVKLPDFRLNRHPLAHLRGLLQDVGCTGEKATVVVTAFAGGVTVPYAKPVGCGEHFAFDGLSPGPYSIMTAIGKDPVKTAYQELTLVDGENEVVLTPIPPFELVGRFRLPENLPDGGPPLSLGVQAYSLNGSGPVFLSTRPGPDGSFTLTLQTSMPVEIAPVGLPGYLYAKGLTYNEAPVDGFVLHPQPSLSAQSFTVVLADRPASVSGKVYDQGRPVPGARVILIPSPVRLRYEFPVHYKVSATQDGTFTFNSLPPGSYYLLAVTEQTWKQLQKPDALASLAAGSTTIQLEAGEDKKTEVDLSLAFGGE